MPVAEYAQFISDFIVVGAAFGIVTAFVGFLLGYFSSILIDFVRSI